MPIEPAPASICCSLVMTVTSRTSPSLVADGQRDLGLVGAEQQIAHGDIGWVVDLFGERFLVDRHGSRKRQAVDRDDAVAALDSGRFGLRADGEADQRRVARADREPGAAAQQQLRIVGRRRVAKVDAGRGADQREQEGGNPEKRENAVDARVERRHRRRKPETPTFRLFITGERQFDHAPKLPLSIEAIMVRCGCSRNYLPDFRLWPPFPLPRPRLRRALFPSPR